MKLKILIIPIILILILTFLVGCSESSPEDIINQYSRYFKNGQQDKIYDIISEKSKETQTKEEFVKNAGTIASDDENITFIINQLLDRYEFKPIDSTIDGNEAYVETRITTPDIYQLISELFPELIGLAFSSENEDYEKDFMDIFFDYLNENELGTMKVYRDIRLVYEDSWKIDTSSFELFESPEINSEEIEELENNEENINQEEASQGSKINDYNNRLAEFNNLLDQIIAMFDKHFSTVIAPLTEIEDNNPDEIISNSKLIITEYKLWQDELQAISPPAFAHDLVNCLIDYTVVNIEFFTYSKDNPVDYDIEKFKQLEESSLSSLDDAGRERDRIKLNFNNEAEKLGIEIPFPNTEISSEEVDEEEVAISIERGSKENPWPVGTEANNGEIIWKILSAKNTGNTLKSTNMFYDDKKTTGKFIKVEAIIKNIGDDTIDTTFFTFKILDSNFREFSELPESFAYIENGDSLELIEEINPGMERKYTFIFEVPSDAKDFMFEATDLELFLESKTYISLGF